MHDLRDGLRHHFLWRIWWQPQKGKFLIRNAGMTVTVRFGDLWCELCKHWPASKHFLLITYTRALKESGQSCEEYVQKNPAAPCSATAVRGRLPGLERSEERGVEVCCSRPSFSLLCLRPFRKPSGPFEPWTSTRGGHGLRRSPSFASLLNFSSQV